MAAQVDAKWRKLTSNSTAADRGYGRLGWTRGLYVVPLFRNQAGKIANDLSTQHISG